MKSFSVRRNMLAAIVALICTIVVKESLAQGDWVNLGSRKANFGIDHDVIPVAYRDGYFTAIRIDVTKGSMNMLRCVVHFENETKQEVELRNNFAPGSESRIIDLDGDKRYIKRIDFWYDTKGFSESKATVTVFGRK
jgi:hypothetical protein